MNPWKLESIIFTYFDIMREFVPIVDKRRKTVEGNLL